MRAYISKYHCELSPIERVWCFAKKSYSNLCGRKDHKATKNCIEYVFYTNDSEVFATCIETMNKHIETDQLGKMWISKLKCINHIGEFLILHVLRA